MSRQLFPRRPLRKGGTLEQLYVNISKHTNVHRKKRVGGCREAFRIKSPESSFPVLFLPLAAAFLPRVVGVLLLLFDVALVLHATVFLALRCYRGSLVASVLNAKDALAFRCNGSVRLRANDGRTKPLGARPTYSVIRATMQQVNR